MSKRVFISDIHISEGRSLDEEYLKDHGYIKPYDWLTVYDRKQFSEFLLHLAADPTLDKVIFLGDLFDTWVYPISEWPATFQSILASDKNSDVKTALVELARKKPTVYVRGNHDMTIQETANSNIVKNEVPFTQFLETYDSGDGIFTGHGHQYMVFNAEDPESDPVHRLPLGHFISRFAATLTTQGKMEYSSPDFISGVIKELLAILAAVGTAEDIVKGVIEFFEKDADPKWNDHTEIKMFDGQTTTIALVKKTYRDILGRWKKRTGQNIREALMSQLVSGLDFVAEGIIRNQGEEVVIFGHTHKRCNWPVGDREYPSGDITNLLGRYGNCGTWCESKKKPYSYITVETDGGKRDVTVGEWK